MTDLVPNEILVRYDENGKFQGAHVGYLKLIRDTSGTIVHREPSTLIPISRPTDPAFVDVLSKVLTDALTENNELKAQIAAHENEEAPVPIAVAQPEQNSSLLVLVPALVGLVIETLYIGLHIAGLIA